MKQKTKDEIKDIPSEKGNYSSDVWIVLFCDLDDFALYLNKSSNRFNGFEVHKIRIKNERKCMIHGFSFTVPKRRAIASSNEFGRYAWAFPSLKMVYRNFPKFFEHDVEICKKVTLERNKLDGGN